MDILPPSVTRFVIIMGTDTMAYAASALSFMLENLAKPVILTGAQIPIAEVYSDARRNLIVSVIFAGNSSFHEVCICFGDHLLRGCRSIKSNSNGLHAFTSPNSPPLATLGVALDENTDLMLPIARQMLRGTFYSSLLAFVPDIFFCPVFLL